MIIVNRLNGGVVALNPDSIVRAECTPDTLVSMLDGTKIAIAESLVEFVDVVLGYQTKYRAPRAPSGYAFKIIEE